MIRSRWAVPEGDAISDYFCVRCGASLDDGCGCLPQDRPCATCGRIYTPEEDDDNGRCCVCNRDDRMVKLLGVNWREIIRPRRERHDA